MWECKGRKDGRGEWGGPDFMTVEGPGFSLSGPGICIRPTLVYFSVVDLVIDACELINKIF